MFYSYFDTIFEFRQKYALTSFCHDKSCLNQIRDFFIVFAFLAHYLNFEMRRKQKKKCNISGCHLVAIDQHYAGGGDIDNGGDGLYNGTDGVNQGEWFSMENDDGIAL